MQVRLPVLKVHGRMTLIQGSVGQGLPTLLLHGSTLGLLSYNQQFVHATLQPCLFISLPCVSPPSSGSRPTSAPPPHFHAIMPSIACSLMADIS